MYAVTFDTQLHPICDIQIAREVAGQMGARHQVIEVDELANPEILKESGQSVLSLQKELFGKLLAFAESKNIRRVLEGTNRDDDFQYRPGIRAVEELGSVKPAACMRTIKAGNTHMGKRAWDNGGGQTLDALYGNAAAVRNCHHRRDSETYRVR